MPPVASSVCKIRGNDSQDRHSAQNRKFALILLLEKGVSIDPTTPFRKYQV